MGRVILSPSPQQDRALDNAVRNQMATQSLGFLLSKPKAPDSFVDRYYARTLALCAARWTS